MSVDARLEEDMKTQMQEAIAQAMFWGGIGCLPLSVMVFVTAFRIKTLWKVWGLFVLGSVAMTHFLWYFFYLGGALGTKVGEFHPTPWWHFYPVGFGVAAVLAVIRPLAANKRPARLDETSGIPPPNCTYEERLKYYSLSDLESIKHSLDRSRFPDRYELLIQEIGRRMKQPDQADHPPPLPTDRETECSGDKRPK